MNWTWIVAALIAPTLAAIVIARPLWTRGQVILGNIIGSALIFFAVFFLIANEYVLVERILQECVRKSQFCTAFSIKPAAFTRYAIWGAIGFVDVFILFNLSLRAERRIRGRNFDEQ
jgi:hypothetical protein